MLQAVEDELARAIERALARRDASDARHEVEIRAGRVARGAAREFVAGVDKDDFDAVLLHTGDARYGWEIARRWHMTMDYGARLPRSATAPFTLRVAPETVDVDRSDRRVMTAYPSTRAERIVTRAIRKERISAETVAGARARVAHAIEHVEKPYQLYIDTTFVRAKVRLSLVQRGWRLDLTRVWHADNRTDIDRALRERAQPTSFEIELEAVDRDARARDGAALWMSLLACIEAETDDTHHVTAEQLGYRSVPSLHRGLLEPNGSRNLRISDCSISDTTQNTPATDSV